MMMSSEKETMISCLTTVY